tara:strand:- start:704 stop:2314 length:1611 start_codon:yes stop_codon:yes gene_type:complete
MNLSELNLDVNTYTDARLQKNFGLSDNYTKEEVIGATNRLGNIAANTLGPDEEEAFNGFLRAAEERLLKKKMVETNGISNNFGQLDAKDILPTDRELTVIPEQTTQIQTKSQVVAIAESKDLPNAQFKAQPDARPEARLDARPDARPDAQPNSQSSDTQSAYAPVSNAEDTLIPLPVPPQPHAGRWPQENLKNITSRIVSIDSHYRQNIATVRADGQLGVDGAPSENSPAFNTDFTLDLSEPLTNVVSIKLYSVQIPTTWYAFDHHLGNTCFSRESDGTSAKNIAPGNYDLSGLTQAIVAQDPNLNFTINPATNILDISADDPAKAFVYYKEGGLTDSLQKCVGGTYIDQNLGWNLGLRYAPDTSGITFAEMTTKVTAQVPANTYGPKYFMLAINDFNQNHRNKGLANMTDNYAPISAIQTSNRASPSAVTKAQLYSQNAQLGYDKTGAVKNTTTRAPGPHVSDTFAMIPLKGITELRNKQEPLIEYDSALQNNLRTYSSPVDIERMRIRLLDDKGNLVNLHDNDWSFSLLIEQVN